VVDRAKLVRGSEHAIFALCRSLHRFRDNGIYFTGMVAANMLINFIFIPMIAESIHAKLALKTAVNHIPKKVFTLIFAVVSKVSFKMLRRIGQ